MDRRVIVCALCNTAVPLTAGSDENAVLEHHVASAECCRTSCPVEKPRCPVKGCREKLTSISTFNCPTCGKKVCMKHRFEDQHDCHASSATKWQASPAPGNTCRAAAQDAE